MLVRALANKQTHLHDLVLACMIMHANKQTLWTPVINLIDVIRHQVFGNNWPTTQAIAKNECLRGYLAPDTGSLLVFLHTCANKHTHTLLQAVLGGAPKYSGSEAPDSSSSSAFFEEPASIIQAQLIKTPRSSHFKLMIISIMQESEIDQA